MGARLRCFSSAIVVCAIATNYTFAADSARPPRFDLKGTAALAVDAPAQRGAGLRLRATLSPRSVQTEMASVQAAGRFALTATLEQRSLVCYSDTIFRDDLEGDGF